MAAKANPPRGKPVAIKRVTTRAYRLPLREKMSSSSITMTHRELIVMSVETSAGVIGTGWGTTAGVGILAVKSLLDTYLSPFLVGEDPRDTARIWTKLWKDCHPAAPGGLVSLALSVIDIALWDIKGKLAGEPLHRLLGGGKRKINVYASAINLHLSMDELKAQTKKLVADGYTGFKMKIGRANPDEDIARVGAVREIMGPAGHIMLDANQKWFAAEAVEKVKPLARFNPAFIEEPLLSDDVFGHALVRKAGGVPVALGETLSSRYQFWSYVKADAADQLQPDIGKVGGIGEWLKVAALAESANIDLTSHGSLEISMQLAGAVPNCSWCENIFGLSLYDVSAVKEPLKIEKGTIALPDTPGHGVDFDFRTMAKHEIAVGAAVKRESNAHSGF